MMPEWPAYQAGYWRCPVPDTTPIRRQKLPLLFLSLAPAVLLAACNTQEKQELAAAIARAENAAARAEVAQHTAEAAAVRARSDKLAAARDEAAPVEEVKSNNDPQANAGQTQDNQPTAQNPG
jgi:hypothetical protein